VPAFFDNKSFATLTPKIREWVNRYIPQVQESQFGGLWEGPWSNWGPNYARQYAKLKIGNLFWPTGASRFGVYYGCADAQTVDQWSFDLLDQEYGMISRQPATFVITDRTHGVPGFAGLGGPMYMLPPVPLSFYNPPDPAANPLYLVTLVDERFFWWYHSSDNLSDNSRDDWEVLFEYFRTKLGISSGRWQYNGHDHDYFFPGPLIASANHIPLPILMDAAAHSIGQRFTLDFGLNGKIWILKWSDSKTNRDDTLAGKQALSGGKYAMKAPPDSNNEEAGLVLPATIKVSFPLKDPTDLNVTMARTAVVINTTDIKPDFVKYDLSGEITFWDTARAFSDGHSGGVLQALAKQIAKDYLYYESESNIDLTLAGLQYIEPCGLFDSVEYCEYIEDDMQLVPDQESEAGYLVREEKDLRMAYTRITRSEWGQRAFVLHHSIDEYFIGSGSGGSQPSQCQKYTIICQDGTKTTVTVCPGDTTIGGGSGQMVILDPPTVQMDGVAGGGTS
jgi:hypothetical protein